MRLRVGIGILLFFIVGFALLRKSDDLGRDPRVIRARLSDVRGMPVGAPVTLAGLKVGSIEERRIGTGYAEIDIQFDAKVDLREDATLYKRRTSLLSGPTLEIDPGSADEKLQGKYIVRVVETSPIGDILYDISEALPAIRRRSEEGMVRAEDMRARVNGPFRERLVEMEKATESIGDRIHDRLGGMNEGLKVSETIEFSAQESIEPGFRRAEELTDSARQSLSEGNAWVAKTAQETRDELGEATVDWSPYAEPMREIDEGQGTLGTLLNSRELHDDVVEITRDTRSFVDLIVNLQMLVGLRVEYLASSQTGRSYVTLKAGRSDRYYYLEIVSSPQGSFPEVQVAYDADQGLWRREMAIQSNFRFTGQIARRVGPAILRFGFKESTFGWGTDVKLIDNRLELSADVFEFGQADRPRLKVAATYHLFGQLYILAGIDDLLNPPRTIDIVGGPDEAQGLTNIYLGRDYFLGGSLQFNDRDLANLLRIGGTAFATLAP